MSLKYLGICRSKHANSSQRHYPTVIEELCHQFSLANLRKSTDNFDENRIVGKGGLATVYKGCLQPNGATDYTVYEGCLQHNDGATDYTVAIKRITARTDKELREFKKEIEMLCQLRHPNLIKLIGFCDHKHEKIAVYEYAANGSLYNRVYCNDMKMEPLTWKQRLKICLGAACGLHYLHTGAKRTIFHRDIQTQNILLDNNLVAKLSNFWLSLQGPLFASKPKPKSILNDNFMGIHFFLLSNTFFCWLKFTSAQTYVGSTLRVVRPVKISINKKCVEKILLSFLFTKLILLLLILSLIGTYGYMAPEILHNKTVTDRCDVYSFGIVLLEVVCKDKMENVKRERQSVEENIDPNLKGKIAPQCWEVFVDVTERCLRYDPNKRPAMGEVEVQLEHALSLQEEVDLKKTNGDHYTLLSTTIIDPST